MTLKARSWLSPFFPFSENNMPSTSKSVSQVELPVKYAVYLVVTRCWAFPVGLDISTCVTVFGSLAVCLCVLLHMSEGLRTCISLCVKCVHVSLTGTSGE